MNQAVAQPKFEYYVFVVSGPHKGEKFRLLNSQIQIGRQDNNHIPLSKDKKISRQHAMIEFINGAIYIKQLSDKNKLVVNGHVIERESLSHGSEISIGDTTLQFHIRAVSPSQVAHTNRAKSKKVNSKKTSNNKRLYIYGGIGLLILYIATQDTSSVKEKTIEEIGSTVKIQESIEATLKERTAKQQQMNLKRATDNRYQEANLAYKIGHREYQSGNYMRALDSFQACLSIYPKHTLCERYKNLSIRKHEELIEHYIAIGLRYKANNQFKSCEQAFSQAMVLLKGNRSDKRYTLANENFKFCKVSLGEFIYE